MLIERGVKRCSDCASRYEKVRGTRQQRGYDTVYEKRRAASLAGATHCALCGGPGTSADPLVADHVVPIAQGGRDGPLQPAHRSCNTRKGGRLVSRGGG